MSTPKRIAVAGAGTLGVPVIHALVNASYPVTILTRSSKPPKLELPTNADVKYATVDYGSVDSLSDALKTHFGVVSTVTSTFVGGQTSLIEAAAAVGIKRFLPAEFGADMTNPNTRTLPVFGYKAAIEEKLKEVAAVNPEFTFTIIRNGLFLEWGLQAAFLLDARNRSGTLFDGGDRKFSTTTLTTVANAVVAVFEHLDETKNKAVYIHDTVVTQKQILRMAQRSDPNHKPWNIQNATIAETIGTAMKVLSGTPTDEELGNAMVKLIYPSVMGEGYGGDLSGKLDNKLLDLEEIDHDELEKVVANTCSQLY